LSADNFATSAQTSSVVTYRVNIPRMSSDSPEPAARSEVRQARTADARNTRVLAVVAALAIVAIGLSLWALLASPSGGSNSPGNFTDAQRADAKTQACTAFATVRTGVKRNTSITVPGGPDDVGGTLGVAANARIALYMGGQYLLDRIGPATPQPLADTARGFANNLMDIGAAATAGALDNDPEQAGRLKNADADNTTLAQMCA
jgi:hypothetical protein